MGRRAAAITLAVAVFSLGLVSITAPAIGLGDILKVGGIAFLVSEYGKPIDKFINDALDEKQAAAKGATKVVPILSLGRGGYVGAAQVVGAPESVKRVKAVVQVEGRFGSFRAQVYVPTTIAKATKSPERAKGVGVSAVVEFKI